MAGTMLVLFLFSQYLSPSTLFRPPFSLSRLSLHHFLSLPFFSLYLSPAHQNASLSDVGVGGGVGKVGWLAAPCVFVHTPAHSRFPCMTRRKMKWLQLEASLSVHFTRRVGYKRRARMVDRKKSRQKINYYRIERRNSNPPTLVRANPRENRASGEKIKK
ncbi:hypothetical protein DFJ73DRAFT_829009 [Zopfochytrium polystomum]|nr:hypothetical protein DFJ73DRAFT_829009 [Zopfochytrium polystomum]